MSELRPTEPRPIPTERELAQMRQLRIINRAEHMLIRRCASDGDIGTFTIAAVLGVSEAFEIEAERMMRLASSS